MAIQLIRLDRPGWAKNVIRCKQVVTDRPASRANTLKLHFKDRSGGNSCRSLRLTPSWHRDVFPVSLQQLQQWLSSGRRSSYRHSHGVHVAGLTLFIVEIFARWRLLSAEWPSKSV